jgi:hypothetical protein
LTRPAVFLTMSGVQFKFLGDLGLSSKPY